MFRTESGRTLVRIGTECAFRRTRATRSLGFGFLEPDFDSASVQISGEQIGLPGNELAALENLAPCVPHGFRCGLDVFWINEAEPEMRDAFHLANLPHVLLEHDHVVAAGSLRL